jgi:hypothetical protein
MWRPNENLCVPEKVKSGFDENLRMPESEKWI